MSIPTSELATEFRHLAVTLTIIIGRLPDENDESFDLMKALAAEQFLKQLKNLNHGSKTALTASLLNIATYSFNKKPQKTDLRAITKSHT